MTPSRSPPLAGVGVTQGPRDDRAVGAEDPIDLESKLQILREQLESLQRFQQQTLENINTVQSKIHEILNTFEWKTLCSSYNFLETCTPSDASLLVENPESLPSKGKVHHDQQPCSGEHVEANSNTGNNVSDTDIPHRIWLKPVATEKIGNSEDLLGNSRILAIRREHKGGHLLSGAGLEAGRLNAAHEKVILSESKHHTPFPKFEKEFHGRDNVSCATELLKQELQNSARKDLGLLGDKTEKSGFLYRGKLNSSQESAEIVTSSDESQLGSAPLREPGLHFPQEFNDDSKCARAWDGSPAAACSEEAGTQSQVRKELITDYSDGDRSQDRVFAEMGLDKLLILDNKEQLKIEKPQQRTILTHPFPRPGSQKVREVRVDSEYRSKIEALRKTLANSEPLQKPAPQDFQTGEPKLEEKMAAAPCEREKLGPILTCLQKECFELHERNGGHGTEISQLTKGNSSRKQELGSNWGEMQQMKERETPRKSELEAHLQFIRILEAKNRNLEMTLQECSRKNWMLRKDLEKLQSDKACTEKKLRTELRNAKAYIDFLKSNWASANRECKRLSTAATNIMEENQSLKKELQEYRQHSPKYEINIRKLAEERFVFRNHLCTAGNEGRVYHSLYSTLSERIIISAKL
ncbi:PREDICTED: coiled-coil domain-containing protein 110 [Eurypyga helias]|uniref:coiled-coil domain-containing protein 110 n=1 Tax=Eurypyga helias TaxID=54383 RepID=UPI0005283C61|nr:PREDICTED: coiled-coil domain-containing protein 110 [Eurypyga helias]